ncbi:MAG: hypothetical protein JSV78_09265 [Phycisphaerales bacterium]|nr:MAG: hypothetical protein JSV78_09265 [Phycisphaerales bacterium]
MDDGKRVCLEILRTHADRHGVTMDGVGVLEIVGAVVCIGLTRRRGGRRGAGEPFVHLNGA